MSDPWGRPEPEPGERPADGGQEPSGSAPGYSAPGHGAPGYSASGQGSPGYGYGQYPEQGYPPGPGWASPGYGYPAPRETDQTAIWALVTAIGSWAVFPFVLAIVSLVLAGNAERSIAAAGGYREGKGLVQAARIIAWANIAVCALFVVFFTLVVVASVSSGGSSSVSGV